MSMIESMLYCTNIPYQGGYTYETAQHRSMYPAEPGYLRNLRHLLDDEKMADLVESVKTYGVLTPVLLRSDGENV